MAAVRSAPVYRADYLVDGNQLVNMQYHMGPVVSGSPTNLYLIWYGRWDPAAQAVLRDFLASLSSPAAPSPSVSDWWARAPRLYADQTGANVTAAFAVAGEHSDSGYSHGTSLRRIDVQSIIRAAVVAYPDPLPLDPYSGAYLVLSSPDVQMEEFCRAMCGFHYFTFASVVGVTVPYAWVGNSGTQCPGRCAYPFAPATDYGGGSGGGGQVLRPPNGDPGVDGMVIVLGHELAELATNPLVNAWYAGDTPTAPTEIADLCLGVYGDGGGAGGFVGNVSRAADGSAYNVNGVNGRRFLVQWLWNPVLGKCYGANASN